jgi:hypothetical protein
MYRAMGFNLYRRSPDSTSDIPVWLPRRARFEGGNFRIPNWVWRNPQAALKLAPPLLLSVPGKLAAP